MSIAAFAGVARYAWSRNRGVFAFCLVLYSMIFLGAGTLAPAAHFTLTGLALFAPLVLPISVFLESGRVANLDLTNPEGIFPRNFFVLPATARELVLPFMLYAALLSALLWALAVASFDSPQPGITTGSFWLAVLATSFIAWIQAIMWTPVRHRFVRVIQLLALLSGYLLACALTLAGKLSGESALGLGLAQFPIAFAVAVQGVAKCRRGESGPAPPSEAREKGRMPQLASPLEAQLWMERQLHRWKASSALLALVPAVLIILLFLAALSGARESDPEMIRALGRAVIVLLCIMLPVIGISTGIGFGSFRRRMQWHQAEAYVIPPWFAALPLATGDFVWAKMRVATWKMLWVCAGVVLTCGLVAMSSGIELALLPMVALVMLVISATASIIWLALLGRSDVVTMALAVITLGVLAGLRIVYEPADLIASLPLLLPIAALVKVGTLAAFLFYVSSRRLLSWRRLAIITGFWAATTGAVVTSLMSYAPPAVLSPITALCAGIVVAPVLGAVAAPAALAFNRAR